MKAGRRWLARAAAAFKRRDVRLVLVALLLAALVARVDRSALWQQFRQFDPRFGAAMVAVFLILVGLFSLRWWMIARALELRPPFSQFLRALWISQCTSELGPPLVLGEVVRFQLMRGRCEPWALAASQAIDRFSGKIVLLLLCTALLPVYQRLYGDFPLLRIGAVALILLAAVGGAGLAWRGFRSLVGLPPRRVLAVLNPRRRPLHYGLSLLIQTLLALNFALAAAGLGLADTVTPLLAGPLLLLGVGSLPGLVSDWGKREVTALVLLVPLGLSAEQSLAVSLIYGALHLLVALPGALLLAGTPRRTGKAAGGSQD